MTSKLVVNTIEADTGISSVSFASSISMSSTSKFFFGDAGINIGADTNINRPAAGVLGFNVNGAEKVRIDSSGHMHGVGVVTATHFYGDGSNLTGISAGTSLSGSTNNTVCTVTGANAIQGEANLTFDGSILAVSGSGIIVDRNAGNPYIDFRSSSTSEAYIYGGTSGLQLFTKPSGGSIAERARIDSSGHLGVGLSPADSFNFGKAVDIGSTSGGFYYARDTDAGSDAVGGLGYSGSALYIGNEKSDGYIRFSTNTSATERMRIDSAGRVLIGTTTEGVSTGDKFTIATSGNTGMTIRSGTSNEGNIFFSDATSGTGEYAGSIQYNHGSNFLTIGTNTTEKLRIDSSGHIGIGTDNPSTSLQGAWNRVLAISAGTSNGSMIRFIESSSAAGGSDTGLLVGQHSNNSYIVNYQNGFISLRTNNAERFVIGSSGQFGVAGANYGTAGQVLKSGGASAAPTWGSASSGGVETYGLAVFGAVYDTNSGYIVHNITTGSGNGVTIDTTNERMTPTVSGTYLVIYNAHWMGLHSSGTTYYNRITKNGSEYISSNFSAYDAGSHMHTVMTTISMNGSSDYVQFEFYENKSGAAAYVNHKSRAVMILLDT